MLGKIALVAGAIFISTPVLAQSGDFHWERAVAAGKRVSISNISGDIRVTTSTSGKVEVTGVKRGDSGDFDRIKASAEETANGVVICVVYDDPEGTCRNHEDGWRNNRRGADVRMSLEVAVPTNLQVSASNVSGDISLTGAHGNIEVTTVSGDVRAERLHADAIEANSVSGDINVQVDEFVGQGNLRFHSVSGDITLEAPKNFGADISMSTVSGEIDSDFPLTLTSGRMRRRNFDGRIGSGGRHFDVSTVSGDLRIRAATR